MKHFNFKDQTGSKFTTNEGYELEVVFYENSENCSIKFTGFDFIIENLEIAAIKDGRVKNPMHKSVFGVGCFGYGPYTTLEKPKGKTRKSYITWKGMLERCYTQDTKIRVRNNSYKDITVCEEWLNFQNFAKWFEENYNPKTMKGWNLDKDILIEGNKIYSPDACSFVPPEINVLFKTYSNKNVDFIEEGIRKYKKEEKYSVYFCEDSIQKCRGTFITLLEAQKFYKELKEDKVKTTALKYKKTLSEKVFQKLINYNYS